MICKSFSTYIQLNTLKTSYLMSKLINFIVLWKYPITLNFMAATHYKKAGTWACSAAPALWNDLPATLRAPQSVDSFKRSLKTFLFTKALM